MAIRKCEINKKHVETETADVISEVTRPAAPAVEGEIKYTATFENPAFETQTKTEVIPANGYEPGGDPNQKGSDGTAVGPGASKAAAEKIITNMNSDTDPKGSVFRKLRLNAMPVKISKKLAAREHVGIRYESSSKKIAAVTKKGGVVTAKKKGTCYVYAYAQNGIFKKIKIVVK